MAKYGATNYRQLVRVLYWLAMGSASINVMLLHSLPASAQANLVDCSPIDGQPLKSVPEIHSKDGVLRGTILITDEQQRLMLANGRCQPQHTRVFRGIGKLEPGPTPDSPESSPDGYPNPIPGPTLRARVGDVVTLTLLNHIEEANFPGTDRGERGAGCDRTSEGYPEKTPNPPGIPDIYPNCFHGSTTGNSHFHGTHTSPDTTGDNVFNHLRPSPRQASPRDPAIREPIVTAESVETAFREIFAECERRLKQDVLQKWPVTWSDLPPEAKSWTETQTRLLKQFAPNQWKENEEQLKQALWPQWYMGAFPHCFILPEYKDTNWPPTPASGGPVTAVMGPGGVPMQKERPALQMGQAPGTHWYHAHKHGSTWLNVSNGLSGAFIIEGKYDDELNAFYNRFGRPDWTRRQPVLVINQLQTVPPMLSTSPGGPPGFFSVNGRVRPMLKMQPGEVQLWRIVNTSPRSAIYFKQPPSGFQWKQLAQDGVQLHDINYRDSLNSDILMATANRVDLLVKAPKEPGSYKVMVQQVIARTAINPDSDGDIPLMSVHVEGTELDMPFIDKAPALPAFLADITDSEVKLRRTITFDTDLQNPNGVHTINGVKFGEHGSGLIVQLNTVEEWKVENRTVPNPGPNHIDHPFHIHINPFQVVEVFDPNEKLKDSRTGRPMKDSNDQDIPKYVFEQEALQFPGQCLLNPNGKPEDWKPCEASRRERPVWWDVFAIPSGRAVDVSGSKRVIIPGYFKLRSRFVDYPGQYVFHCHILAHEDRGMMAMVQVKPFLSGMSHH